MKQVQQPRGRLWAFALWMTFVASVMLGGMPQLAIASASLLATGETYTVRGTVRNHDGTPAPNVHVSTGWLDPDIAFATTDEQGNYTLMITTPGVYHIQVSHFYNKLDPPAQTVTLPPSQTGIDFTFPPYHTIRGMVKDADGLPVEGATVATDLTDPLYVSTVTDANGAYTLAVVAGIYHVSASKYGYVSPPAQRLTVPPDHTDVNFAFFVPYTIQGTVYTHDGKPASGISISTSEDDPVAAYAMTETDGTYTLLVRAGTYHLHASFVGLGSAPVQVVTVPPNRANVDFQLPDPVLIRGTVRDDLGRPVVGAFVGSGTANITSTAEDGTYTLAVPHGEHLISAYSDVDGYNSYDGGIDYLMVKVPPAADDVDFVLRVRNRTIRGRVIDDQGQPVALAKVFATNPLDSSGQVKDTDADGYYTLYVAAGVYWVNVVKDFNVFDQNPNRLTVFEPSLSYEIDVSEQSAEEVNFTLQPVTGIQTIRGRVQDHAGGPIVAMVSAMPTDPYSCYLGDRVSTDETGAYTITVKPGTYEVSVFHERLPELPEQRVSVPTDANVNFAFPQLYAISGRVTDAQGKPLQYILMQATTDNYDGIYNSGLTGSDGWYSLILAAGTYTITAYHQDFAASPAQVVTVLPERDDINFVMSRVAPPDQLIQGRVLDEHGRPAANAVVRLAEVPFSNKTIYYNGTFSFAVYPGTYTVSAGGFGFTTSAGQQVTVPPGPTDLTFTVRSADEFIFGQVTDESGTPLCAVRVDATGDAASTYATTDRSGRFALRVPAGDYTLRASRGDYPSPVTQMVTVPPTVTQLKMILATSLNRVEGTVQDTQGAPVAGASVIATGAGGEVSATTNADGNYILHLADGSWNISVRVPGVIAAPGTQTITVPPHQTKVNFQVSRFSATNHIYLPALMAGS